MNSIHKKRPNTLSYIFAVNFLNMNQVNIIILISLAFLLSCGKKTKTNDSQNQPSDTNHAEVAVDSSKFEVDTFHVIEKEKECAEGECSTCDLYYEKIRQPFLAVHDSVNIFIDSLMVRSMGDIGYSGGKMDLKKIAEQFINDSEVDVYTNAPWDWSHNTYISHSLKEIFAVTSSSGGYTGGAHGNYYTETVNFFTRTGKRVTLSDLFSDIDAVNRMAVKYFKQDNQIDLNTDISEEGFMMGDKGFTLNENFDIS